MPKKTTATNTKLEVAKRAKEIRKEISSKEFGIERLLAFISQNRGEVKFIGSSFEKAETLHVGADKKFTVYLSEESATVRQAFTIAHELGHLYLHTDMNAAGEASFARRGSDRQEWEANWFAAELLMPEKEFRIAAKECWGNPDLLADRFGVSTAAALIRLKSLGLE